MSKSTMNSRLEASIVSGYLACLDVGSELAYYVVPLKIVGKWVDCAVVNYLGTPDGFAMIRIDQITSLQTGGRYLDNLSKVMQTCHESRSTESGNCAQLLNADPNVRNSPLVLYEIDASFEFGCTVTFDSGFITYNRRGYFGEDEGVFTVADHGIVLIEYERLRNKELQRNWELLG